MKLKTIFGTCLSSLTIRNTVTNQQQSVKVIIQK
ncbi:MAG: hypothetical protein RLZZ292_1436 [Bacteroidota bacterium]|jgi:hypothetical protein